MNIIVRVVSLVTLIAGGFAFIWLDSDRLPDWQTPSGGMAEKPAVRERRVQTDSHRTVEPPITTARRDTSHAPRVPSRSSRAVIIRGDRLSLDVTDVPLRTIVERIQQQSGIAIELADEVRDPRISMQIDDLPLAQGLQRMLEGFDSFFLFSAFTAFSGGDSQLSSVWVYPQGRGRRLTPIPSSIEMHADELQQDAGDPDVLKRAWATATLIERNGDAALELVKTALADPEDQVRSQALAAALYAPVNLSAELLKEIAQHDPSPTLRTIALAALANADPNDGTEQWGVSEMLEIALRDPDPEVSELAAQLLDHRNSASDSEEDQAPQGQVEDELPGELTQGEMAE